MAGPRWMAVSSAVMHGSIPHIRRCSWTAPSQLCIRLRCSALQASVQTHQAYVEYHDRAQPQQARHLPQHEHEPLVPDVQQSQHSQQQQQQQQTTKNYLKWQQLHRAAQMAAWSGLCYHTPESLQATIDKQHLPLTLLAQGRNEYTAWFIADGVVPHAHFCNSVRRKTSTPASTSRVSSSAANGFRAPAASSADPRIGPNDLQSTGAVDVYGSSVAVLQTPSSDSSSSTECADVCAVPEGVRERFVFLRGVQWRAPDADSMRMSQALMRIWPVPFPRSGPASTQGTSSFSSSKTGSTALAMEAALVAHDGVAEIATGLFDQLRPYLDQADDVGMPVCFAGHSLGGSLSLLTMVLYQLHSRKRIIGRHPTCYTFGSPPVLAHEQGGGGHRALQALGLPTDCVQNFVLENDPVPRAMLSVDPTFELLKEWSAVKGLLQLRGLLAGQGSPLSPGRFLFEAVGQVQLIKWTAEGGSQVVPLDAHEIESELSFVSPKASTSSPNASNDQKSAASVSWEASAGFNSTKDAAQMDGSILNNSSAAPSGSLGGVAAALTQWVSPLRGLQAWLDHHHGSYAQELEAAALRGIKEQIAQQQYHAKA